MLPKLFIETKKRNHKCEMSISEGYMINIQFPIMINGKNSKCYKFNNCCGTYFCFLIYPPLSHIYGAFFLFSR